MYLTVHTNFVLTLSANFLGNVFMFGLLGAQQTINLYILVHTTEATHTHNYKKTIFLGFLVPLNVYFFRNST